MTTRESKVRYPAARIEDVADTLTGVSFPDPYRWLEPENEEVHRWQKEQSALASAHVREWPHFARVRELVEQYSTEVYFDHVVMPISAGGLWFRTHIPQGATQAQALVADSPLGEGRVLFDPASENAEQPPYLSWISPSPDGRVLAVGVCTDGSENNTIRLIDVASGRLLPDAPGHRLMDNNTGGVQWLADSSGFFFSALIGAVSDFDMQVYLHERSPSIRTERVDVDWTVVNDWRFVAVARDGRHAVALEQCLKTVPVAVARLGEGPIRFRPFVTRIEGKVAGEIIGDRYIGVTDVDAPRGRLVAIPLGAENPNDPGTWQELVPESDAVLRSVAAVGNVLYLTELVDTYARVRIVDANGKPLGEVPLPKHGAIVTASIYPMLDLITKCPPDRFLFAFSSLTVSRGIYSHRPGDAHIETVQQPAARLENAVVEDRWAISEDGTRIPYHLVRRADVSADRPQATLINAYGGFGAALVPQFPGPMAAFVAAGGVFVHAHLRGGCELGLEWWQGGRMGTKQNCYRDLFAIAEDLIAANRTSKPLLAVTGESNGGLMAGNAVTQRPDLWGVVIPRVPLLDLIGACRTPYGLMAVTMDLAEVEHPEEVRRLAGFSPYHLVREGVSYPAVFVDAGATDPKCPPWHARKFVARLQHATTGDAPILLRVWENVGHGAATDKAVGIDQYAEWLAFTLQHLGVRVAST